MSELQRRNSRRARSLAGFGWSLGALLAVGLGAPIPAQAGVVATAVAPGRAAGGAGVAAAAHGAPDGETAVDLAAARRAVVAMREACAVNMMSRVYRPQPECQPRRAAVLKLGELGVVALRSELLEYVARTAAPPAPTGQAPAAPRRFPRADGEGTLVGALQQIGTPSAVAALLDVATAPGVELAAYTVLLPAHRALLQLTKAKVEVSPRSQADMPLVSQAWRVWRAEHEGAQEAAPAADPAPPAQVAAPRS